jgi:hypothetical protein
MDVSRYLNITSSDVKQISYIALPKRPARENVFEEKC